MAERQVSIWTRLRNERITARDVGVFLVAAVMPLVFVPFARYPFSGAKLAVLLLAVTLIAFSRPAVDRTLAIGSIVWVAALALTAIFGMDPWWSVLGSEYQGAGIAMLGSAAFLLCVGSGLDERLRRRIPYWLFWSGVVVAVVTTVSRFMTWGVGGWLFDPFASTVGHRVFVGGFLAASALAATAMDRRWPHHIGLVALGTGLSISAVRSAWIGAVVGIIVLLAFYRDRRRAVAATLLPIVAAITFWTVISPVLEDQTELGYSALQRFGDLDEGSATERPPALRAYLRGWRNDPILGSGPSTGLYVFLANATEDEVRIAGRGFGDAHNMIVELLATTGVVGFAPLAAIAVLVLIRLRRAPPERAWALGGAIAASAVLLAQPMNVLLTPTMFFLLGLAIPPPEERRRIPVTPVLAVPFAIVFVLAGARVIASSFDLFAATYASESAYRWALRFEPRRMWTKLEFANHRAFDYRTGDPDAEAEARDLIAQAIDEHGWNPRVRGAGANVMMVLDDPETAETLIREELELFPNDAETIAAAAALALRRDDLAEAEQLARRALRISPESAAAKKVLQQLEELESADAEPE